MTRHRRGVTSSRQEDMVRVVKLVAMAHEMSMGAACPVTHAISAARDDHRGAMRCADFSRHGN